MRRGWQMVGPGQMERVEGPIGDLPDDHVLVRVAGCGVCHTDLGFFYDGVRTRHALPLTLGHEISGFVVKGTGKGATLVGQAVIVPAVIPCGACADCLADRGGICTKQVMPGNDVQGGFASHVIVPAEGLCVVPDCVDADAPLGVSGVTLRELSVVADAVSTPYQAIRRAELQKDDVAIVVGVGGVGGYAVQIAAAFGAHVIAVDVNEAKLAHATRLGAVETLDGRRSDLRAAVRALVKSRGWPMTAWKIFECSGHPAGQTAAFDLLGPAATLMVVGFTREQVPLRLANLMAFDATARGNWGCLPRHYPAILTLVLDGRIDVAGQTEVRNLAELPEVFAATHHHGTNRRIVLAPESA